MRAAVFHPVLLILCCLGLLSLAGPARADEASPYGINAHQPTAAELDAVAAAGIGWIRVDFNWWQIEPSRDAYNWAQTDAIVDQARARGLEVFATLAYTPGWANGGAGIAVPPTDPAHWYDFVYDTVRRYRGKVRHWGLWNEPNLDHFFAGTMEQYMYDIAAEGARAVRDADPNARTLGPELSDLGSSDWAEWMYVVLSEVGDAYDIITHHIYEESGYETIVRLGIWAPLWERPLPVEVIEATGHGHKPLWLTEAGWRSNEVGEEAQARNYVQTLDGMHAQDWLDKVFFYELRDDPSIPDKWGMMDSNLNPKEAYWAYLDYISGGRFSR